VLISSGESLCIRLPTNSEVRKGFFGTEVAADNRLIIVVFSAPQEGGLPHPTGLFSISISSQQVTNVVPLKCRLHISPLSYLAVELSATMPGIRS